MISQATKTVNNQNVYLAKGLARNKDTETELKTAEQSVQQSSFDISRIPVRHANAGVIQPKLKINRPGDRYEQEADRVADQVMRMQADTIQRKCSACEAEEDRIQRMPASTHKIQRKCAKCEEEEDEELQMKTRRSSPALATDSLTSAIQQTKGRGQRLDKSTSQFMSTRLGRDLSDVRIHTGAKASRMNREINAKAFTVGRDIYFDQGQYSPGTNEGKRLLAHELTHVRQQTGGLPLIQREPSEVDITHNGEKCTAKREYKVKEKSKSVGTKFDIDTKNITLNINWCKGDTKGDITIGADVPAQAGEIAKKIFKIVRSGGSSSEVADKLKNTDLTPFVELVIKKRGKFGISARGEITTNLGGVSGGKGSMVFDFGPAKLKASLEKGKDTPLTPSLGVEIELGRRPEKVDCPTTLISIGQELSCNCTVPAYEAPITIQVPYVDQTKYLYFEHNSTDFTPSRIDKSRSEILKLLKSGYQVRKILGFTSPEGTSEKSSRYEGNITLAEKRAIAAKEEIERLCKPNLLEMRDAGKCHANVLTDIEEIKKGTETGELHSSDNEGNLLRDDQGKELKGKELADKATSKFDSSEDKDTHLGRLTEDETEGLEKATNSEERAKYIYRLLRRVEIIFKKEGTRPVEIMTTIPEGKKPCPPEVIKIAREKLPDKIK